MDLFKLVCLRALILCRRLAATMLDFTILLLLIGIFGALAAHTLAHTTEIPNIDALTAQYPDADSSVLFGIWYQGIARGLVPYVIAMLPMIWWIYESFVVGVTGGSTIGKWVFRLKVTTKSGGRVTAWGAIFRGAIKLSAIALALVIPSQLILAIFLLAWFAVPLFSSKGQLAYDLLTGMVVVGRATPKSMKACAVPA